MKGQILLRGMSIGALILAVLSPKIHWSHRVKDPHLAVVWDESASMGETDTPSGKSRWSESRAVWENVQRDLPPLTVHHYVLGAGGRPVEESALTYFIPSADECSFGALRQVLASSSTRAILLFSDGRASDRPETSPGVPIFAVGVGGGGNVPDIAMESVQAPPLAYAGLSVDVLAHLTASGPRSSPVRVVLLENGIRRANATVDLSSGSATVPLTFTPSHAGFSRCEIRADIVPGETRTANNLRRFLLEVQRSRVRTLYISGRPGPHYNFLRAQLKNDPSVELVSFVVLRDPEDVLAYADTELSLIPFPTSNALVAQLPTFDVVVLEEISGLRFGLGQAFFSALEKWVRAGGGFLSIHEPPDLRPLDIRPGGEQNLGELSRLDPWATNPSISGPERFRLKVTDSSHPVLSLADGAANGVRWAHLSLLEGSGRFFSGVLPDARVLAVEPIAGAPVLAERSLGRGRVMGLANSTSWRWALDGGRRGEGPADYQRFWENSVRWLAGSPGSGSVRLVRPGGPLSAHESWEIRLRTPPGLLRPPKVWAVAPGGNRITFIPRPSEQVGEYTADFTPPGPGTYELHAETRASDGDRLWLEVSSDWDEALDTRPDFSRLKNLARLSGGHFVEDGNIPKKILRRWLSQTLWEKRPQGWGTPFFFVALAMACLAWEWIYRRRRGLP